MFSADKPCNSRALLSAKFSRVRLRFLERLSACHSPTALISSTLIQTLKDETMDKAKQSGAASAVATGLRGVVAASSSIGDVNGEKGELIYQGVNIHDLATKS